MRSEFFDVVNAADEVIDRKPRAEVHQLGLLHRAVHVLVFNSRGQVFLQKRSRTKDRQPGLWDTSASGHVDAGEDYDAAAMRELREELGIAECTPQKRLFKLHACAETDNEFVWVYQCEYDGPISLNTDEIETGAWFEPAVVTRWVADRPQDFASTFKLIWARLAAQR
jgi:isopentenyl-diphosphate delta-isomerase type 1